MVGSVDTNLQATFNYYLGTRYQTVLATLKDFKTAVNTTFSTTASTQYYANPLGTVGIDGMFITIGSVNYPLQIINSIYNWENLNAIQIQASAIPQFYFPRRDDYGIWPIPQATYTGTITYHYRDRNLLVSDYSTGTVTMTNGSAAVVGVGTTFTAGMVGQWLTVTDTTIPGHGYFIRVTGYTDPTHITVYQNWPNATAAGVAYKIGETPEIPEEGHRILLDGVMADYYTYIQKDTANAALFTNIFWTGNPRDDSWKTGTSEAREGLVGLINRYSDRDDTRIIKRKPRLNPLQYKVWATSLS